MKKFFVFAVMMLMSTAASFGINFGFAEVDCVAQLGNGFYAYTAGGESVSISAYQYTQMKDADGYYILSVDGKKVVVAGNEFAVEKLTVDSVGLEGSRPKVFFTDGSVQVFKDPKWLKLLKGQTIRRACIDIPTWEWENYATVDKGDVVIYHDKVAPSKRVSAPSAKSPAPEKKPELNTNPAPTATAQSKKGNGGGISFRITH